MKKSLISKLLLIVVIVIAIAQFFQPEQNNGELDIQPFYAETNPSNEIKTLLQNQCFDCHSNKTNYPWYSKITPVNYWMADHVKHGKGELNFSDWSKYSLKRKEHKMEEVWEEVKEKHMPIDSYTWTHGSMTDAEIELIVNWGKKAQTELKAKLDAQAK